MVFGLTSCTSQADIDNAVNSATATLNEQITTLEADIADKEAKIATLESEKAALIREKEALDAEITALETKNGTLTAENAALNAMVTELEASITAKDTEIANLNSSIATLTAEKQALTNKVSELEKENKELEDRVENLLNCARGNHEPIYTANADGLTHSATCCQHCDAEITGEPEAHTFGTDNTCICGVLDAIEMTNNQLNATIAELLSAGERDIYVVLAADAPAEMITAIRRAICDTEGVANGSIHLTLAGVTAIPVHDEWNPATAIFEDVYDDITEAVRQLASISLPDVVTIGNGAFKACSELTSLYAPKVQTVGKRAFPYGLMISTATP